MFVYHLKDDADVDKRAIYEQLGIPETDDTGKFEQIEGTMPTFTPQPKLDGHWFNVGELARKLNMSPTSIRSQMKRFIADEPDFLGIWKAPDNRLRCNENFVKEVFGRDAKYTEGLFK
jgi:hypothetical protein